MRTTILISLCLLLFSPYSVKAKQQKDNTKNGHEHVDLGLPSGTLWATENIGADCATDDGVDICWGDKYSSTQGNIRPNRLAPYFLKDY